MTCTHPVIYTRSDGLYCHICGALINPPVTEETPVEGPKKAVKRKRKEKENNG